MAMGYKYFQLVLLTLFTPLSVYCFDARQASFGKQKEAVLPKQSQSYLDTHIHLSFSLESPGSKFDMTLENLEKAVEGGFFKRAFLISPSYTINPKVDFFSPYMSNVRLLDELTAVAVSKFSSQLLGICGFNHNWIDYNKIVSDCLKKPQMIGIKSKLSYLAEDRLTNQGVFSKFFSVLSKNKNIKVVLIHMPDDSAFSEQEISFYKDVADIDKLILLASRFNHIQFVVAHSLNSVKLTNYLAEKIQKNDLENVWVETSFALYNCSYKPLTDEESECSKSISQAWEKFPHSNVLFGSDQAINASDMNFGAFDELKTIQQELFLFKNNKYLSVEQKEEILFNNSKRLIKLFNQPES